MIPTVVVSGGFYRPIVQTPSVTSRGIFVCFLVGRSRSSTAEPSPLIHGKTTKRIKEPRK